MSRDKAHRWTAASLRSHFDEVATILKFMNQRGYTQLDQKKADLNETDQVDGLREINFSEIQ